MVVKISPQSIQEMLLAQPHASMPAAELTRRFAPSNDKERQRLVQALSTIADVVTAPNGEPLIRLRASTTSTASAPRKPGHRRVKESGPLPIEPVAIKALLLAQPNQEMPAAALSARFAPADEADREALVAAIAEVAELIATQHGAIVRLLPKEQRPPRASPMGHSAFDDCGSNVSGCGSDQQPITPVERDLVRKVLTSVPGGSMRPADLVRMLAPNEPAAKRRLARVLAEVAHVADGHLVLKELTNQHNTHPHPGSHGSQSGYSELSEARTRSQSWAARSDMPPTPQAGPPVEEEPEEPAPPTVVSEELVVEMLRETNGRMASSQLIANLQPLDKAGQRALASIVQRVCKTLLSEEPNGGATIVLREALVREKTEGRAANTIQRAARDRADVVMMYNHAATVLQGGVRRLYAVREVAGLRIANNAACVLQTAARRRGYIRELHRARLELHSAIVLQMGLRRMAFHLRVALRVVVRDEAATRLQAGRRTQLAKRTVAMLVREAIIAKETPEEREVRVEREKTELLREKLRRRKRQGQRAAAPATPRDEVEPPAARPLPRAVEDARVAAERTQQRRERWPSAPSEEVEEQEDGGLGAVLARLGVGSNEEVPAAVADRAGGDDDEDEDPLAAMRRMMAQHGGESDED